MKHLTYITLLAATLCSACSGILISPDSGSREDARSPLDDATALADAIPGDAALADAIPGDAIPGDAALADAALADSSPKPADAGSVSDGATDAGELARSTAEFLDSLGVCIHAGHTWTENGVAGSYGNTAAVEDALSFTGIKHIRDSLSQLALNLNAQLGVKLNALLFWPPTLEVQQALSNTSILAEVEGANEIDITDPVYQGQGGVAGAKLVQNEIWSAFKGQATTQHIPVLSFSVANPDWPDFGMIGDLSSMADEAAVHLYTQWMGGNETYPGGILTGDLISRLGSVVPDAPPVVTEFGWWTVPMQDGVTGAVAAKYTLTFFFSAFEQGIRRSYLYELNDEWPDNATNRERHFGLYRADWTPKQAAVALHNLTTILADQSIAPAGRLAYLVNGLPPRGKTLLLQRSDGKFFLVLWNDTEIWDNDSHQEIAVGASQVSVTFPVNRSYQVFDPLVGTAAQTQGSGDQLSLSVPDHPILVLLW